MDGRFRRRRYGRHRRRNILAESPNMSSAGDIYDRMRQEREKYAERKRRARENHEVSFPNSLMWRSHRF